MIDFFNFLSKKVYKPVIIRNDIIDKAFKLTVADYQYHFSELDEYAVKKEILSNGNALAVFLFRLGNIVGQNNGLTDDSIMRAKEMLHWLMKEMCSVEIYFNNSIGPGFLIVHGEGTVIGSRNRIGNGFIIHQGCTIGHKKNGMGKPSGAGCKIGHNVIMYVNSTIIGEIEIGDNVTIGAHTLINTNILSNQVVFNKHALNVFEKPI